MCLRAGWPVTASIAVIVILAFWVIVEVVAFVSLMVAVVVVVVERRVPKEHQTEEMSWLAS